MTAKRILRRRAFGEAHAALEPIGIEQLIEPRPLHAIARQHGFEPETGGRNIGELVRRQRAQDKLGFARPDRKPIVVQMRHKTGHARSGAGRHHATLPISRAVTSRGIDFKSACVFKRQMRLAWTAAAAESPWIERASNPISELAQSSVSAIPGFFSNSSRRSICTKRTICRASCRSILGSRA